MIPKFVASQNSTRLKPKIGTRLASPAFSQVLAGTLLLSGCAIAEMARANDECGTSVVSLGGGWNGVSCPVGTYASGITYPNVNLNTGFPAAPIANSAFTLGFVTPGIVVDGTVAITTDPSTNLAAVLYVNSSATVTTTGANQAGVLLTSANTSGTGDAVIQWDGDHSAPGSVTTSGNDAAALSAYGGGGASTQTSAQVNVSNLTVTTTGTGSAGLLAIAEGDAVAGVSFNPGSMDYTATHVKTSGDNADGMRAWNKGGGAAIVSAGYGIVETTGDNAAALHAIGEQTDSTTSVTFSPFPPSVNTGVTAIAKISTQGTNAHGMYAENHGEGATTSGVANPDDTGTISIATYGNNSNAVYLHSTSVSNTGGSEAKLYSGAIETHGNSAHGLRLEDRGSGNSVAAIGYYIAPPSINPFGSPSITTTGDSSEAISSYKANAGNTAISFVNGTYSTAGSNAMVVHAVSEDAGGGLSGVGDVLITVEGGVFGSTGDGSTAIQAENALAGFSHIIVDELRATTKITTSGFGANGIVAIGNGARAGIAKAKFDAGTIITTGDQSLGIAAYSRNSGGTNSSNALVDMKGGSVSTGDAGMGTGDGSTALYATSEGTGTAQALISGGTITTLGAKAHGLHADRSLGSGGGDALARMIGGTVTTAGENANGLYAVENGSGQAQVYIDGSAATAKVTTTGDNAIGAYAYHAGAGAASVVLQVGSAIDVSGDGALGASAYSFGGGTTTLELESGSILAYGAARAAVGFNDHSGLPPGGVGNKAEVTIAAGMSITGQNGAYAIWNGDDQASTDLAITSNGAINGDVMLGGGSSIFTLAGGVVNGAIFGDYDELKGVSSDTANQGSDDFIWSGGVLNGGFYGQGGNDSARLLVGTSGTNLASAVFDGGDGNDDMTLANRAPAAGRLAYDGLKGASFRNFETFTLGDAVDAEFIDGGLELGSAPNSLGTFNISANASLRAGASRRFDLDGNLVNGGVLSMADGNADGNLVIAGDYTSKNGKLAIDVDFGALDADTISFGGAVGGFTGIEISDTGTNAQAGVVLIADMTNSSDIDTTEFGILSSDDVVVSGVYAYNLEYDLASDPASGIAPGLYLSSVGSPSNPTKPKLQPFAPLLEAYQATLLDLNRLPTMRQRVGKRAWLGREEVGADQQQSMAAAREEIILPPLDNLWGRVDGNYSHNAPESSSTGYVYDLSAFEMQAGLDGLFYDEGPGALVGGLTTHYRVGEAKVQSGFGDSKIHPDGWGIGGTLTWYGENGFYADGQAEATWYSSELKADNLSRSVNDSDAFGYALSVEVGQRFDLDSDGLALTPQAQLLWSSVDIDSFTGAYNEKVSFQQGDSLMARLGLALEKEVVFQDDGTGPSRSGNVYGIANIFSELADRNEATISAYQAWSTPDSWTGEIGFGGTFRWQTDDNLSYGIYGEVAASTGFDTGTFGYSGNIGFEVRW